MSQEPYRLAKRFFWIFTDGSSHRGQKCVRRHRARWPSMIPVRFAEAARALPPNRPPAAGESFDGRAGAKGCSVR